MGKTMRAVKALRKKIPSFKCLKGCTACCGPTVFSGQEWERVQDKRRATSLTCPYAGASGCDIYKDRPILCRLFGTVERMTCPHGCGPKKLLTPQEESGIREEYDKLLVKGGILLMKEVPKHDKTDKKLHEDEGGEEK